MDREKKIIWENSAGDLRLKEDELESIKKELRLLDSRINSNREDFIDILKQMKNYFIKEIEKSEERIDEKLRRLEELKTINNEFDFKDEPDRSSKSEKNTSYSADCKLKSSDLKKDRIFVKKGVLYIGTAIIISAVFVFLYFSSEKAALLKGKILFFIILAAVIGIMLLIPISNFNLKNKWNNLVDFFAEKK